MKHPKPDPVTANEESVWNYPRPPRLKPCRRTLTVVFNGKEIARTNRAYRVLETSHPPGYYIPKEDTDPSVLLASPLTTGCEWKGTGKYYHLEDGDAFSENAAWYYDSPRPAFAAITNYLSFYPGRVDYCTIDGEKVTPQPGGFYGGWITSEIKGPFKGIEGSWGW